jgi:bacterioferritin-associated ferredoxin
MIVCVCNRLNETKIRGAIARGAASPDQVYAGCGVNRKCGTCHETIAELLQQAREDATHLQAAE